MIETKVLTMFLSSGVNVHGDSTLHVFGKRSVSSKATYSNVSKEKFSLCPTAQVTSSSIKARMKLTNYSKLGSAHISLLLGLM